MCPAHTCIHFLIMSMMSFAYDWCRIQVLRLWSRRVMLSLMFGVGFRYFVCGHVGGHKSQRPLRVPWKQMTSTAHVINPEVLNIPGYSHGVGIFVQCSKKWRDIAYSTPAEEVEWVTTEVERVNITNVYKPPGTRLCIDSSNNLAFTREISTVTALRGDTAPLIQTVPHSNTGLPMQAWHCYMILNSLVASAQHDRAHVRICVLPILEHVRVGESSNAFRSPSTDHQLSSHRQPSTRCQNVLSIEETFGRRTGRSSQTDSTRQPTSSPAQRQNRARPIKHGAQQSYQLRRRPSRGVAKGPDSNMGRSVPTTV